MSVIEGLLSPPLTPPRNAGRGMDIPAINLYTPNGCNPYTGYGRLELGIARELQRAGVQINVYPEADVPTLVLGAADNLRADHVRHTRRYILTQSESTQVSEAWVDLLNWNAEAVFVTNPDLVEIYESSGVYRPVVCVGHGIDLRIPVQAAGWDGKSRFEWLTYSYGDLRKGAELAIQAFKRLFQGDARHHLTIKARDGAEATWIRALANGGDPQLTVVFGQQSEWDWMKLLSSAHCFLFPSRAEGFGMPPREATLVGVPTIATQWLGMADVNRWGLPIKVKDMRVAQYDIYTANRRGAKWAEPDLDHLMEQMRFVYGNYAVAREMAMHGKWYIRMTNRWDLVVKRIIDKIAGGV